MAAAASRFAPSAGPATDRNPDAATGDENLSDAGLVRRFNTGDESAFVEIVARYRAKLFQVALRLLRNDADAEEIAQDVLIRAHRNLACFRGDCSLATWLHRIALNLSYNRHGYFFRRHRHDSLSLDAALNEGTSATLAEMIAGDEPSPVREIENNEFVAIVARCIDRLTTDQRAILSLRTVRHHTYEDISRALGVDIGTVKSRIARARNRLRTLLAVDCPEFGSEASPLVSYEPGRSAGCLAAIDA